MYRNSYGSCFGSALRHRSKLSVLYKLYAWILAIQQYGCALSGFVQLPVADRDWSGAQLAGAL